jgi:hypothetical protein
MKTIEDTVQSLIQKYIDRQLIVLAAIKDLRPKFLLNTTPAEALYLAALEAQVDGIPDVGYWGDENEWSYHIHGGGCRLIHTVTEEPIDWNAPNPEVFDLFSFLKHLEWEMEQESENDDITIIKHNFRAQSRTLREFVLDIVNILCQNDRLIRVDHANPNKFILK